MLREHFAAVEQLLLAKAKLASPLGHNTDIGQLREFFVQEFLARHFKHSLGIGSGEVIDSTSTAGEKNRQIDLVLYRREYPLLDFWGPINAFICESVIAAIEVKTTLTKQELRNAVRTARKLKTLRPSLKPILNGTGLRASQPKPLLRFYIVAYGGPKDMLRVGDWLNAIHAELGISGNVARPSDEHQRMSLASPSVDGIYVLGKGFIHFDNTDVQFTDSKTSMWFFNNTSDTNLLFLFFQLTTITKGMNLWMLNLIPYLESFNSAARSSPPLPKTQRSAK